MTALPSTSASIELPANVRHVLRRVAWKVLLAQVMKFPLLLVIWLLSFWLLQSLVDMAFNLSWLGRAAFLMLAAAITARLFCLHVIIPLRRRLQLRSAALLVERTFPQFQTSLISAVDFAAHPQPRAEALVHLLLSEVGTLVDETAILRGIVDTRPLRRLLLSSSAILLLAAGLIWFGQPHSFVLLRRIFLSHEALPSRTTVVALTGDLTLNTGSNVELAARAERVVPRNGRLVLVHADGHREEMPVSTVEGGVFRAQLRNILQPFQYYFEINDGVSATFHVRTRTLPALSALRFIYTPPPHTGHPATELPPGSLNLLAEGRLAIRGEANQPLRSASLELKGLDRTLPMESGDEIDNLRWRLKTNQEKKGKLESTLDQLRLDAEKTAAERNTAQLAMEESKRLLEAATGGDDKRRRGGEFENAANTLAESRRVSESARARLEQTQRELDSVRHQIEDQTKQLNQLLGVPAPDLETAAGLRRIVQAELQIPREGLTGLSIHLVNEEGVASENDPVYRLNITVDKPPAIDILEPRVERRTVLATDRMLIRYRVRDDYRIEKVAMRYVVLRPNANGESIPAEEGNLSMEIPPNSTTLTGEYLWNLSTIEPPLSEGCSVTYQFEARDHYTLYSDHPSLSRKLILAVVSPEEKKAELIAEMEKAAQEIERLSDRQRRTNEKTDATLRR